jgi:hypothetical protein
MNIFLVGADSSGNIQCINVGTSDNIVPIYYELETQDLEIGNKSHNKQISNRMAVFTQNAESSTLMARTEDDEYGPIEVELKNRVNISKSIGFNGRKFNFKWFGNTSNTLPVFEGLRVEDITDFGIMK